MTRDKREQEKKKLLASRRHALGNRIEMFLYLVFQGSVNINTLSSLTNVFYSGIWHFFFFFGNK